MPIIFGTAVSFPDSPSVCCSQSHYSRLTATIVIFDKDYLYQSVTPASPPSLSLSASRRRFEACRYYYFWDELTEKGKRGGAAFDTRRGGVGVGGKRDTRYFLFPSPVKPAGNWTVAAAGRGGAGRGRGEIEDRLVLLQDAMDNKLRRFSADSLSCELRPTCRGICRNPTVTDAIDVSDFVRCTRPVVYLSAIRLKYRLTELSRLRIFNPANLEFRI